MTDKLKPCPHCEQIPKRHIFEDGSGFITCKCDKLTGGTTIFANWRRPDGKITKRRKEVSSFSEHEADIIWNSRPIEDALKARIAELEAEVRVYKFALENAIIDRTLGGNTPLAQYVADARAELNRQAQGGAE